MNLIKNEILNKQDIELKENARIAAIKKLEKIISEREVLREQTTKLEKLK